MKCKIVLFLSLLLASVSIYGQEVSNIQVSQIGEDIVITYDLDKNANISLLILYGDKPSGYGTYWLYNASNGFSNNRDYKSSYITGDVGYVRAGKNKTIVWNVLAEKGEFIQNNVRFEIRATSVYNGNKTFLLAEYGYGFTPQHSWGFTIGQSFAATLGFGWYSSIRTNFSLKKDNGLICTKGGYIDEILPFYSGHIQNVLWVANAGIIWNTLNANKDYLLTPYIGIGYGLRHQLWETADQRWVTYSPTANKGISGELGVIGSLKGFTLMIGINTIGFRYWELEAGIGWTISHRYKTKEKAYHKQISK